MGFFALIGDEGEKPIVEKCHINLWALPVLRGYRFVFDVGVALRSPSPGAAEIKPIRSFKVALPFSVHAERVIDLHDKVVHVEIAHLIFGRQVGINGDQISFTDRSGNQVMTVAHIAKHERLAHASDDQHSLWKVEIDRSLGATETYVRFRFIVQDFARTWVPRRGGALVDLRVADIRETLKYQPWQALEHEILPIRNLRMFAVLPASLAVQTVSPAVGYIRLLEGSLWEEYLDRSVALVGNRKLMILKWGSDGEVGKDKPFRAFLDVAERRAVLGWRYWSTLVGLLAVTLLLASRATDVRPVADAVVATIDWAYLWLQRQFVALGIGGAFLWIVSRIKFVREGWARSAVIARKIEDAIYRLRMRE